LPSASVDGPFMAMMDTGDFSYGQLVETLDVEVKARSKISSKLSNANVLRDELQQLLDSNAGKRPQFLPGVSRKRREELEESDSPSRSSTEAQREPYKPRMRLCACGCGEMVLGESHCEGEVSPMKPRALDEQPDRSPKSKALLAKKQKSQSERLTTRRAKPEEPDPAAAAPQRVLNRDRLEQIAKPRDAAPEPRPPTPPPPPRPAPAPKPPSIALRRAVSEATLLPNAGYSAGASPQRMAPLGPPVRKRATRMTPTGSDMPGLSKLLQRASAVQDDSALFPGDALSDDEYQWRPKRVEHARTKQSQKHYVEARLYRKGTGVKAGSLEDLQMKIEQAQRERMGLQRELQEQGILGSDHPLLR